MVSVIRPRDRDSEGPVNCIVIWGDDREPLPARMLERKNVQGRI